MIGIVMGCILGMCPLFFIDQHSKELRAAFDKADKDGNNRCSREVLNASPITHKYLVPPSTSYAAIHFYPAQQGGQFLK